MPVVSDFILYVGSTAYDLRKVSSAVPHQTNPLLVMVRFIDEPRAAFPFVKATFEPAWETALNAAGGGGGGGVISSGNVSYTNPGYPSVSTVQDALDAILYTALTASMSNTVGTVEIGSTVTGLTLSWSYNKPAVVSQSISPGFPSLPIGDRSSVLSGLSLTSDTTWTLTGNDGTASANVATSVAFRHRRRWGFSAQAVPDQALIDALANSEFATARQQSRSLSPSNQYIYFAWPTTFGTPTFIVNGLLNTGYVLTQVNFTNASGNTTQFDVWRSGFLLTGSGIQVVVQ